MIIGFYIHRRRIATRGEETLVNVVYNVCLYKSLTSVRAAQLTRRWIHQGRMLLICCFVRNLFEIKWNTIPNQIAPLIVTCELRLTCHNQFWGESFTGCRGRPRLPHMCPLPHAHVKPGEMWDGPPDGSACTAKGHDQTTVLAPRAKFRPPDDSSCCVPPPTVSAGIPILTAGGPLSSHLSHNAGARKCPQGSTDAGGGGHKNGFPLSRPCDPTSRP